MEPRTSAARVGLLVVLSSVMVAGDALAKDGKKKRPSRELVEVAGVLNTHDGQHVVVLRTQIEPTRYLPIWIGEIEALNIRLRLQRQDPPRPLTLNLLESVLASDDIRLTSIAIDDLKGGVFLGTLYLKRAGRNWKVDARPSDAIGLAVGSDAPIWVSREVIESAAVDPSEFDDDDEDPKKPAPKKPVNYEETL